jgi:hypothetical protein
LDPASNPILAALAIASLSRRKDRGHRELYAGKIQQEEMAMRIFERIRQNLGFLPVELQKEARRAREQADVAAATAYVPDATDGMCCGHCAGEAEGHIAKSPAAH